MTIYFIGAPCSGKTTMAKEFQKILGWEIIDDIESIDSINPEKNQIITDPKYLPEYYPVLKSIVPDVKIIEMRIDLQEALNRNEERYLRTDKKVLPRMIKDHYAMKEKNEFKKTTRRTK